MAEEVRKRGGEVHLKKPVRKILTERNKVVGVEMESGTKVDSEHVISTMPLTTMVKQLDGAPSEVLDACRQLRFRNTILVYLEVLNENPFTDNWIYVHSAELRFGRVTNFRNWGFHSCTGDSPNAILVMEYWCDAGDEFWQRDDQNLVSQAKAEIVKSGLVKGPEKLGRANVVRIPKCYPVYTRKYQEYVKNPLGNT